MRWHGIYGNNELQFCDNVFLETSFPATGEDRVALLKRIWQFKLAVVIVQLKCSKKYALVEFPGGKKLRSSCPAPMVNILYT